MQSFQTYTQYQENLLEFVFYYPMCFEASQVFPHIVYADDIALIANSLSGLVNASMDFSASLLKLLTTS